MAQSYEDPAPLVPHRLLAFERSHLVPGSYQLSHHYFLTRLQLALKAIYIDKPTEYLMQGLHRETSNFLLMHGTCTALGLNVPCPYFIQEILIGAAFHSGHQDQGAAVARLLIAAEISARDEAFVRSVCGPEADEWWYQEDAEHYPPYREVWDVIHTRVQEFWKAGQLGQLPDSYTEGVKFLLDLWFESNAIANDYLDGATGSAAGAKSNTTDGALDSGDVEMAVDSTEQSNTAVQPDPIFSLAVQLDLISPETPLLSEEDRHDLALLDKLTQTHTRLEQVKGLETEIAATEKWNFDTVIQLLDLAKAMNDIPFEGQTELFDLETTGAGSAAAPTGLLSKGKGRLDEGPRKTSLDDLLSDVAKGGFAGSTVNPLPPMPLNAKGQDFNHLCSDKFPDLFGPTADHHCEYREHLFQLVAADLQQSSTQKLAALLSYRKSKAPHQFGHSPSNLAANTGARLSHHSPDTANSSGPANDHPIPNVVERTPAASLAGVDSALAIQLSSQPTSVSSGSRRIRTPSVPPPLSPRSSESSAGFDSSSGLLSQPRPHSGSEGSSSCESDSSSGGEDDTAKIDVDYEGPGITFSTSNTM